MIEVKIWPEGHCDECKRKTSESIKVSIQELHDGVYEQGKKDAGAEIKNIENIAYNNALHDFRSRAQKLIETKKRTINKSDLFDIECDLMIK